MRKFTIIPPTNPDNEDEADEGRNQVIDAALTRRVVLSVDRLIDTHSLFFRVIFAMPGKQETKATAAIRYAGQAISNCTCTLHAHFLDELHLLVSIDSTTFLETLVSFYQAAYEKGLMERHHKFGG